MDARLATLASYLRVGFLRQALRKKNLTTQQLMLFKMLVNSTPGVISIFVGSLSPVPVSNNLWYNLENFYEPIDGKWVKVENYKEVFTSILIDVTDDTNVLDFKSVRLLIDGPENLFQGAVFESTYTASLYVSDTEHYSLPVHWSLQKPDPEILVSPDYDISTTVDFSAVTKDKKFVLTATYNFLDVFTLQGQKTITLTVPVPDVVQYQLQITGPDLVAPNTLQTYQAKLLKTVNGVDQAPQDVTNLVKTLWSFSDSNLASFIANGTLKVKNKEGIGTIEAKHYFGNSVAIARHLVQVQSRKIVDVKVTGISYLQESTTTRFSLIVYYDDGSTLNSSTSNLPVTWRLLDSSLGRIDATGKYQVPNVDRDTYQTVIAEITESDKKWQATFTFLIYDLVIPQLSIEGPDSILESSQATYTAYITTGNSKFKVTPSWVVNPKTVASIDFNGNLTSAALSSDTSVLIQASISYQGYPLSAIKTVTVKNKIPVPVTLTIQGPEELNEGASSQYSCYVTYDDGHASFVNPLWFLDQKFATINDSGLLKVETLERDTILNISAQYIENEISVLARKAVLLRHQATTWTPLKLVINGSTLVSEGSTAYYSADLIRVDSKGNTKLERSVDVEWNIDKLGRMTNNGTLYLDQVGEDTTATITATYRESLQVLNANLVVNIKNKPKYLGLLVFLRPESVSSGEAFYYQVVLFTSDRQRIDVSKSPNLKITLDNPTMAVVDPLRCRIGTILGKTGTLKVIATYSDAFAESVSNSTNITIS